MRKFISCSLILLLVMCIVGCSSEEAEVNDDTYSVSSELENTEEEYVPTEVSEAGTANTQSTKVEDEVKEEENIDATVYVAKNYDEVYPMLYDFYEPTENVYTRWVYSITSSSNFIGSIYLPDGRVVVGSGTAADDKITVDTTDDTYKRKQGNDPIASTVEWKEVNPSGEDFSIPTLAGDVKASTKFKDNLRIKKENSTEYKFELTADSNIYILEECTSISYLDKLFNNSLYKVTGTVSADNDSIVRTNFATYVKYVIQTSDNVFEYAAVCIPFSMSDTVFVLYKGTDYEIDCDLLGTLQSIFEGVNS